MTVRGRAPLVLGLRLMTCAPSNLIPDALLTQREHELILRSDHRVVARCLAHGDVWEVGSLHEAGAVLLDAREQSA